MKLCVVMIRYNYNGQWSDKHKFNKTGLEMVSFYNNKKIGNELQECDQNGLVIGKL